MNILLLFLFDSLSLSLSSDLNIKTSILGEQTNVKNIKMKIGDTSVIRIHEKFILTLPSPLLRCPLKNHSKKSTRTNNSPLPKP